ncbi:SPOR domain-containing protein [Legionella jordanis]|uniref:SPOR domain-containing protein n=1 Tax=Legionella jordanis TaxID=456 RepID=A0A0W0VEB7_9GAMM|nr:SPOR domain-containing protein [Legionella jordanis]KTD18434.1 hypothetical protein Ljor_2740 [Legionella jordanis]RMX05339.1 SPOR domain-containing protein [Legionella jordanis]RMX20813.1 SPOR domain-containing protein [Legionella jordanis]VEH13218.1 Uncharacterized protein conserved in bacteria [Legionella jordanis]HAT8715007.1 SPOR domain-containing protein [Legionella jordanis]
MNNNKFFVVCLCVSGLSACTSMGDSGKYINYRSEPAFLYQNNLYYESVGTDYNYDYRAERGQVRVPNSYHVGPDHSPASFKDIDRTWVNQQSPQGYTIQISEGEKASQVAKQLYKAPKNDRTAQIQSQGSNGQTYYKGVYGSYNSYEDAQKALNSLPPELKAGANIKNWGAIQSSSQ